jgi:tetratricopeptide (TPR) repeat protein
MRPWIYITIAAVLLVLAGIWLVWPQSPETAVPTEYEEEDTAAEVVPAPAPAPASRRPDSKVSPPPEKALDLTEVIRAREEVEKNQQALKDWDQKLAQACKNLVKSRKYEEAQQCYQLRLARNPEDAGAYMERGILHARMGKRTEAYWDYVKYLELDPDGPKAPQIRKIVEAYDQWASGGDAPARKDSDYREEIADVIKRLYEEAYIIKNSDPEAALRKLRLVLKVAERYAPTYQGKAERLIERIGSGLEDVQK